MSTEPTNVRPPERRLVVVAELGEALSLDIQSALYQHNDKLDVLVSGTSTVTRALLARYPVAALAVAADPQSAGGIISLQSAGSDSPAVRVAAVSGDLTSMQANFLFSAGAHTVLPRSDPAAIGAALQDSANWSDVMSGSLGEFGVADVLQLACIAKRTVQIRFVCEDGRGVIWVVDGEIEHAVWKNSDGLDALGQALGATSGNFYATIGLLAPRVSIQRSWQSALIEAARCIDENAAETGGKSDTALRPSRDSQRGEMLASRIARLGVGIAESQATTVATPSDNPDAAELKRLGMASLRAGDLEAARTFWARARAQADQDAAGDIFANDVSDSGAQRTAG